MTKMREDELRAKQRREASERAAQIRQTSNFYAGENKLDVPPGCKKDGYDLHYARSHIRLYQDDNLEHLQAAGFEAIPANRATNSLPDPLSRSRHPGYINKDDCVLMEIPTEINKERKEYHNKKAQERLDSLQGVQKVDPRTKIQIF